MADLGADWSLYPYDPVKPVPIVFAVIVGLLGAINVYQAFFQYTWKHFGFLMTWASSVWMAAFILRAISVNNVQNVNIFIAQYVMVIAGPPLYSAATAFIFGRILAYLPYHALLHPGRVVTTYFFISAIIEVFANAGAGNSIGRVDPESASQVNTGLALLRAGFIIHCLLEPAFMALVAITHYKAYRTRTLPSGIRIMFYILYLTSSMILLRTIIRTVEAFERQPPSVGNILGYNGYVSQNEWMFYVFEGANVILFVVALTYWTPGRYMPRSHRIFLDPTDGKTERLGPGFKAADKRPLWLTFIDPFDLSGILTGRGQKIEKFWEQEWPEYIGQEIPKDEKGKEVIWA